MDERILYAQDRAGRLYKIYEHFDYKVPEDPASGFTSFYTSDGKPVLQLDDDAFEVIGTDVTLWLVPDPATKGKPAVRPIDQIQVGLLCRECRRSTQQNFGWIRDNTRFACDCGAVTDLTDQRFRTALAKIERFIQLAPVESGEEE